MLNLLSTLFARLPIGVVVLNKDGRVEVYNEAEARLAGRSVDRVMGKDFFAEVAPCLDVAGLGKAFRAGVLDGNIDLKVDTSFPFSAVDRPRDVQIRMQSLVVEGDPYAVLLVEDVSSARSIERMKETLSSLLVHDLKSPLAVITANLGFVETTSPLMRDPELSDAILDSAKAARRLQRMLTDLLDVTRLESDAFPLTRTAVDLRTLVSEAVRDVRVGSRLAGKHVAARLREDEPLRLQGDATLLRRLLDNLIDNALRYATRIEVAAFSAADGLHITVADDGPGIPAEHKEAIFGKYFQVTSGLVRSDNRGLGLSLVRLAARSHGGDVSVDCPPKGGSVFDVVLPFRSAASE